MKTVMPAVGKWYKDLERGVQFEVVAYDEREHTVGAQHLDGEIEEYDFDSWKQLILETIAAPEDWRSGYELSEEDYLDPDDVLHPEDWSGALTRVEPDQTASMDDLWPE